MLLLMMILPLSGKEKTKHVAETFRLFTFCNDVIMYVFVRHAAWKVGTCVFTVSD